MRRTKRRRVRRLHDEYHTRQCPGCLPSRHRHRAKRAAGRLRSDAGLCRRARGPSPRHACVLHPRRHRLQSVGEWSAPFLLAIIRSFHAATGVPMILNTSFNVMGRPMVHDVEDAAGVFLTSDIDVFVLGDALFRRRPTALASREGSPGERAHRFWSARPANSLVHTYSRASCWRADDWLFSEAQRVLAAAGLGGFFLVRFHS
ncbi:carbamoyltransferase C-terminal domain-containing protein [Methylobacterium sp. NPDC080182]|uniref:carbamoyltransferase C-terminal domain-containing protein n=1 Tax=Methylobacterium sp. NPDC080182 TaxID=3390590 RepID=UPI003D052F05